MLKVLEGGGGGGLSKCKLTHIAHEYWREDLGTKVLLNAHIYPATPSNPPHLIFLRLNTDINA